MPAIRSVVLSFACALVLALAAPMPGRARGASTSPAAPPARRAARFRAALAPARAALPPLAWPVPPEPAQALPPPRRPVTIYLHGICGNPDNGCPYFRDGVTDRSYLLCPRAPFACRDGGASWHGTGSAQQAVLVRALDGLVRREGAAAVDRARPPVLIGFSEGAYTVQGMVRGAHPRGVARAVALIAANITLTAEELRAAGVRRVLFAAGRRDGTRAALESAARRLARQGFPARFLDLGAVGHTYVPSATSPGWRAALQWLEEAE
jgi:predicted esterase